MATINDIVNLDSRRGDVAAGGGDAGAFQIDTRPLQTLGLYTNLYNKTLYEQTVQDRNEKIKQVAEVAKIDVNNLYGKDKDYLVKKLNNLRDVATQYAKNPNLTIDDQLKWQTALSDVNNDYQSGKQRAVTYHAQLDELNKSHSGQEKEILLKELNDKMENTDISTPISAGTGFKPVSVELPAPATLTFNTLKNGANEVVDVKSTVYNPQATAALAQTSVLGLNSLTKGLTGTEAELQQTANGEAQHWAGMKDAFNAVMGAKNADGSYKYFDANGQFLADKFETDNAGNIAIMQPYKAMVGVTNYSTQKVQEISNGLYTDKGVSYQAPPNLTVDMFKAGIIKFTPDGVSADQLAQGGMFQKYLGDQNVKTFKETNTAIDQQKANAASSNAALGWRKLAFDKDKWKATQSGDADMKSSALAKAQRIYGELKNLADAQGVISPDKLRQLNSEQLKYLGGLTTSTNPTNGNPITEYTPLKLNPQSAIQLKNGQIQVMNPVEGEATLRKTEDGRYMGHFDNTKSTNITNVATNILNEQLKNAGTKELNTYAPIDYATNSDEQQEINTNTSAKMTPLKDSNYYSDESNTISQKGNIFTYKDGSVWEYNPKTGKINQIK